MIAAPVTLPIERTPEPGSGARSAARDGFESLLDTRLEAQPPRDADSRAKPPDVREETGEARPDEPEGVRLEDAGEAGRETPRPEDPEGEVPPEAPLPDPSTLRAEAVDAPSQALSMVELADTSQASPASQAPPSTAELSGADAALHARAAAEAGLPGGELDAPSAAPAGALAPRGAEEASARRASGEAPPEPEPQRRDASSAPQQASPAGRPTPSPEVAADAASLAPAMPDRADAQRGESQPRRSLSPATATSRSEAGAQPGTNEAAREPAPDPTRAPLPDAPERAAAQQADPREAARDPRLGDLPNRREPAPTDLERGLERSEAAPLRRAGAEAAGLETRSSSGADPAARATPPLHVADGASRAAPTPSAPPAAEPGAATSPTALREPIEWLASRGGGSARIRLNPPQLGEVDVRVRLHQGALHIQVLAHERAAHHAIEANRELLLQSLGARELRVESLQISSASDGESASQFESRGHANARSAFEDRTGLPFRAPRSSVGGGYGAAAPGSAVESARTGVRAGSVDLRV